jgi:hypothetical protein
VGTAYSRRLERLGRLIQLQLTRHRNLPKIRQPREPEPSTVNEKTIADFTRVVEEMGILERDVKEVAN